VVDATPYSGGIAQRRHSGGGLLALEIPPGATEPYLGLGGILPVTETLMPDGEWHGVASSPGKGLDPHPAKLLLDSGLKTRRPGSLWPPCLARHRKEVRQRGANSRRSQACHLAWAMGRRNPRIRHKGSSSPLLHWDAQVTGVRAGE
jgi:hypothetical protein